MSIWPVREASASDWPAIKTFFKSLDKTSRYMYFGAHMSDEVIDQIWKKFESNQHEFFLVETTASIIGVCQIAHSQSQAELSVAVDTRYRNMGIAHALVERAVSWCKTHDIHDLMMFCLPDNDIIPKILKRHNLLPLMLSKPAEARFHVPEGSIFDYQRELVNHTKSNWLTAFRRTLMRG